MISARWSLLPFLFLPLVSLQGAEISNSNIEKAKSLAHEALRAEASGDTDRKADYLRQAATLAPDEAAVRWQQGQIKNGKQWQSYDESVNSAKEIAVLQTYRKMRDESAPTLESQLSLARFCRKQGLKSQALAHWSAVVELQPDHAEARGALGFQRANGRWVKPKELTTEAAQAKKVADTLRRLTPELKDLVKQLDAGALTTREGSERLLKSGDVSAIPAWESLVSSKSEWGALAVIGALDEMSQQEATLALTRHALASPFVDVQKQSLVALKKRNENAYLPALMSELRGPWIAWRDFTTNGDNQLVYRYSVVADGLDKQTLSVIDDSYFLQGMRSMEEERASNAANITASQLESRRRAQNAAINAYNDRVMALLTQLTGVSNHDSPQDWWQWWDDRNEVYTSGTKPLEMSYASRSTVSSTLPPPPSRRCECLAAGTPILTQRGPVAVERVRMGDMVVAQHPVTGEVSYQPVLRTTIREPEPLIRIALGDETIRASGGHPFWVSGKGWLRARQLEPGMRMHGLDKSIVVNSTEVEEKLSRSYNLVVADVHSYFVGTSRILSHDNSIVQPTTAKLPGLGEAGKP